MVRPWKNKHYHDYYYNGTLFSEKKKKNKGELLTTHTFAPLSNLSFWHDDVRTICMYVFTKSTKTPLFLVQVVSLQKFPTEKPKYKKMNSHVLLTKKLLEMVFTTNYVRTPLVLRKCSTFPRKRAYIITWNVLWCQLIPSKMTFSWQASTQVISPFKYVIFVVGNNIMKKWSKPTSKLMSPIWFCTLTSSASPGILLRLSASSWGHFFWRLMSSRVSKPLLLRTLISSYTFNV